MRGKLSKKHLAAIAFVGALAITGVSVAYFTGGSGSVNAPGSVGTSSAWSVTTSTPTWSGLTALYPGASNNTEFIPFTVTNNGHGQQAVTSVTVTLPAETNGDAETAGGADIPGCLATWFTATTDAANSSLPSNLSAGGTYTGKIDLTMKDSGTNQNACESAAPAVTITAS
jgi:hypothetical protein